MQALGYANMAINDPETNKILFGTHTVQLNEMPIMFSDDDKKPIKDESVTFSLLDPVKVTKNLGEEVVESEVSS